MLDAGRSPALRYGVAVLSVAAVTLIRFLIYPVLGDHARFLTYILAVMVSSWYGGVGPGLASTALSALVGPALFPEPAQPSLFLAYRYVLWEIAFFSVTGVVVSFLNQTLRSEVGERRRAEQGSKAQAQALTDVIERLAQERDLERLQGLVLAAIVNQLRAEGGALWYHDGDTDLSELVLDCQEGCVTNARDSGHPLAGERIAQRETPGWEALKVGYLRGECLQVADLRTDARVPDRLRASLLQLGARSFLMVPMRLQDRLVGFFSVRSARPTRFSAGEVQLAQALAHQATLATELTRLADQSRYAAVLEERERAAEERAAVLEVRVRERTAELEAATEELRRHAELLDICHDAVIVAEAGRGILFWNRGAEELYAWKRSEVLGKSPRDVLDAPLEVIAAADAALARDGQWNGEGIQKTRDGRQVIVDSRIVELQTGDGRRLVLLTNRDVTARKQSEAALQASETRYRQLSDELEQRVRERTAELSRAIEALHAEVAEREQAERASRVITRALTHVLERFTREPRMEEFPGIVLSTIVEQFEAAAGGSLWCYDEGSETFEPLLHYQAGRVFPAGDPDQPFVQSRLDARRIPHWEQVKAGYLRGECLVVTDPQHHPALEPGTHASYAERGVLTLLGVPLLLQGRLVGNLSLRSTREESYGGHDFALAVALGHLATLALEMARLAERVREAAVLEERNRMAREIHDTLAQAFTGIILQLEANERVAAGAPERGQAHLRTAGAMAREGLSEARRSVQALRPQALEKEDLAGALAQMVERLSTNPATRINFRLGGAARPLPPAVADHLLRMGQEAVTNALRHAQAREIGVELVFGEKELTLRVTDDGRGFAQETAPPKGHFGLTGMQERASLIGAQFSVQSQPDCGTKVELAWRFPFC